MTTLEEVARFCEPGARRNYHKIALTDGLPTTPGVYIMRDAHGHALYIGKAENLRRRTRDHFLQRQAYHARQALELLERIEVIETGSEFGALLLEQRLIARHRPHYNSHGTRVPSYQYVKLSAEAYPRLYATPNLRDDGAYYAGPFRKASTARRFIDCLTGVYPLRTCARLPKAGAVETDAGGARSDAEAAQAPIDAEGAGRPRRKGRAKAAKTGSTTAPAPTPAPAWRPAGDRSTASTTTPRPLVRRVLEGDGLDVDRRLQERQAVMVERLAFEQAARLQRQREALERALRGIRRLRDAQHDPRRARLPGADARAACASGASPTAPSSPRRRSRRARSRSTAACSSWRRWRRPSRPRRRCPPRPSTRSSSSTAGCSGTPRRSTCSTSRRSSRPGPPATAPARATRSTPRSPTWPRSSSPACASAAPPRRTPTRTKRSRQSRPQPERPLAASGRRHGRQRMSHGARRPRTARRRRRRRLRSGADRPPETTRGGAPAAPRPSFA